MDKETILENLCSYDKRNPSYFEDLGTSSDDCFCDNCFYGRTQLANEILRLMGATQ